MDVDTISLVGLGKLGLCLAAVYAVKGKRIIGVDILQDVVDNVNNGISPLVEPGLASIIATVGGKKLLATTEHSRAITESDITIILTATPSMEDGSFSNIYIEEVLTKLSLSLKKSKKLYHLFVISSTVIPGSIEDKFIPLIEEYSGRMVNEGFGICYDPDFVALGSVIKDFMNPEVVVIGENNSKDGALLESVHRSILDNKPQVCHMSLASAEVAKVSLNAYITFKISFANLIGNICNKISNASPDDITGALGQDKRISPYYFKAGLSYGGTCFPRDTWAFSAVLKRLGLPSDIMSACNQVNIYQDKFLADKVLKRCKDLNMKTVGILGLAFKPGTPVIVESPAIKLIDFLLEHGIQVVVYDPLARDNTEIIFGDKIRYTDNVAECLTLSPVSVFTVPSKQIAEEIYQFRGKSVSLLDCWRILDKSRLSTEIACF
jgi:UDPglucose 6-dehydrogenase